MTTTPRNVATLKEILARDNTRSTHASTDANRANLAKSFLQDVRAKYAGTRLARQELDGVLLDQEEGALWSHAHFTRSAEVDLNSFDRIVVAVDPGTASRNTHYASVPTVPGFAAHHRR